MVRLRTICFVMIILLFSLSAIAYGEIAWTTKRLTSTAGSSENPAVAVEGSNIYIVYEEASAEQGKTDIYLKKSVDEGLTWIRKRLAKAGYYHNPAITVEGSNVYVVWDDQLSNGEIYLKQSHDGGTTWTPRQGLTWRDSDSLTPDVAVNGSNIYVVWRESTLSHNGWAIYLKKSDDGGSTWLYKNLSGWRHLEAPKISVDGANVYVVWQASYGYSGGVSFIKSIDGGATWETVQTLDDTASGFFYSEPAMAVNGQNIYVVWSRQVTQTNNDIFLRKSTDGGISWETEKRLSQTPKLSLKPAVAVNGQNIYVVWQENNSEIHFIQSTDGGVTWEAQKRLTWTAGSSLSPKIVVQGTIIYVVWQDYTRGNYEIFFKKGVVY
jgi:hypothetical protein